MSTTRIMLMALVIVICLCGVLQAVCPASKPLGHYPAQAVLNGYVPWDGANGTSVTVFQTGQSQSARSNFTAHPTDGSVPGFYDNQNGTAYYRDNWANAGISSGCPAVLDSTQGCASSFGDSTAFIFETVYDSTEPGHSMVYVAAAADWDPATGSFRLGCRGNLTQLEIPQPIIKAVNGADVIVHSPLEPINVVPGSAPLTALGYQFYYHMLGFAGPPRDAGPWTAIGPVVPPNTEIVLTIPGKPSGDYYFALRPVFSGGITTTHIGRNSEEVSVGK